MTPAAICFGWWLCFNSSGTFSSNLTCIPMISLKACQASAIQHGPSAFGFELQKVRQQFCINGTIIRVKIGAMTFLVKWSEGYLNESGNLCGCWVAHEKGHHPPCWTDGVCWESNEEEMPSETPITWQPYISPAPAAAVDRGIS